MNQFGVSEEFLEKAWVVKTDSSVKIFEEETTEFCDDPDNDPFTYVGIEIASPMLYKWFIGDPAVNDQCIIILDEMLEALKSNFRVLVNNSCGMHVHVENFDDGFEVHEMQKIMAFFWTFEPGTEKLHPPGKRDGFALYRAPLRMGAP